GWWQQSAISAMTAVPCVESAHRFHCASFHVPGRITAMLKRSYAASLVLAVTVATAQAASSCSGNSDALGTDRVLSVDPEKTPRIGRKHFPQTLALRTKEVVLTFDDGPEPHSTPRVLEALKRECVRASFFLLGQSALAHPELTRRELAEGHTVAHHSYQH